MPPIGNGHFAGKGNFVPPPAEYQDVRVITGSKGKAVQAKHDFSKGAVLLTGWGSTSSERTIYTIQVSHNGHVEPDPPIVYLNHSCAPNCGLLIKADEEVLEVHALRDITAGDEITIDYATFEGEISSDMPECQCGETSCRHTITGFGGLSEAQRASYGPYIAPYLLEKP